MSPKSPRKPSASGRRSTAKGSEMKTPDSELSLPAQESSPSVKSVTDEIDIESILGTLAEPATPGAQLDPDSGKADVSEAEVLASPMSDEITIDSILGDLMDSVSESAEDNQPSRDDRPDVYQPETVSTGDIDAILATLIPDDTEVETDSSGGISVDGSTDLKMDAPLILAENLGADSESDATPDANLSAAEDEAAEPVTTVRSDGPNEPVVNELTDAVQSSDNTMLEKTDATELGADQVADETVSPGGDANPEGEAPSPPDGVDSSESNPSSNAESESSPIPKSVWKDIIHQINTVIATVRPAPEAVDNYRSTGQLSGKLLFYFILSFIIIYSLIAQLCYFDVIPAKVARRLPFIRNTIEKKDIIISNRETAEVGKVVSDDPIYPQYSPGGGEDLTYRYQKTPLKFQVNVAAFNGAQTILVHLNNIELVRLFSKGANETLQDRVAALTTSLAQLRDQSDCDKLTIKPMPNLTRILSGTTPIIDLYTEDAIGNKMTSLDLAAKIVSMLKSPNAIETGIKSIDVPTMSSPPKIMQTPTPQPVTIPKPPPATPTVDAEIAKTRRKLVSVYQSMKPGDVVAILAQMPDSDAIAILKLMQEKKLAKIMSAMSPTRAAEITQKMAGK